MSAVLARIREHMARLRKSRFIRNVAIVASGTAGAQAIAMAFSPVITRLYGPEAFGVLGTFAALLAVLAPLAALSYPIAIVLPKRDAEAVGLVRLSLGIALSVSLLITLILLLFKTQIVSVFKLEAVESFVLLLPLAMFCSAAVAVMSQWVIRKKLFKIKARVAVAQALWLNLAKAGFGLMLPVAAVLVILAILGSGMHALMLWAGVRRSEKQRTGHPQQSRCNRAPNKLLAWRYRDFVYYRTPQELISSSTQSFPVIMLAALFGPASAGFYALGRTVLMAPSQLIGNSVRDVVYPKMAEAVSNKRTVAGILLKSTLGLFLVGIIPYGLVVLLGPSIFSFIFGDEWVVAGEYARWLSLMMVFGFANKPSVSAIPVLGLNRMFLFYGVFSGAMRVVGLFVGYWVWNSEVAAIVTFSLLGAASYFILFILVFIAAREADRKVVS